jgi:t-SNARE complex subunit (syntaxin)
MVDIEKAKQSVTQIEARHRDITKIEKSITELHSMFLDLAQLVAAQV